MLKVTGIELRMTGYVTGWIPDWIEVEDIKSIATEETYIDDSVVFINNNISDKIIIHKAAKICSGAVLYAPVEVGPRTFIGHNTVVRDHTKFGPHCKIGGLNMFEGENDIGSHVYINAQVHITRGVTIGKYSFLGAGVLMANDSKMYHHREGSHADIKPPKIGEWCKVGNGSSLMPGIEIGNESFVAANSIVTKNIPPGELWLGQPAKFKYKIGYDKLNEKQECKEC